MKALVSVAVLALLAAGCGSGHGGTAWTTSARRQGTAASPSHSRTSLSPLQVWWDGMRPLVVAIGKAGNGMQCTTVTPGSALQASAARALSYVENSSVPAAYDNITLALDRALALYQAAGGFCEAAEQSLAASYFARGNTYLKQAVAAVRADGDNPAGAG